MDYYIISALINCFTSLILGFIVLLKNPKRQINLSFGFFAFAVSAWALFYYFWQISITAQDALFWLKVLMAAAVMIPAFYLHFVFSFLGIALRRKWFLIISYSIFSLFLLINFFSSHFISDVKPALNFRFWPVPGMAFFIFFLLWFGYIVLATFLLYRKRRQSYGVTKQQINYILWGMVIGFAGGSTNYFLWFDIPIAPVGNILVSVYVAMTAYVIIKHRFLDIGFLIARSLAFTFLVLVLGVVYSVGLFFVGSLFFDIPVTVGGLFFSTALALAMASSFQTLRRSFEQITDKVFYRRHYSSEELLAKLGKIMSTEIELKKLTEEILENLISEMKITKGAFILLDKNIVYGVISRGYDQNLNSAYNQIVPLLQQSEELLFDEMEEGPLKQILRDYNIFVLKVLVVKNEAVGLLILGEKASGEVYSSQDINLINILSPEVAVAIQNAKSVDQIKRFNITLQNEVNRATKDLQIANKRLKELDELKDDFVSVTSHELRTPMTAIRSYAWMALHRSDMPLSKTMEKYIVRILMSAERMINLVSDMLNISRIESGRIEINPEPVDLILLCKDILDEVYYSKATEKNIQFQLLEQAIPKVFADPEKLRQVLLNIMGNALKFSPLGGKITIGFFTDGKVVETYLKDQGPGISQEDMGKLFKKFGRLDASYTAAATSGGTGLGLYISRSLIDLMHGRIWAISEGVGKGATFTFALPVASQEVIKEVDRYRVKAHGEAKGLEPVVL